MTYLLIVLSLNLVPDMVRLHNNVADFLAEEAPKIVSQVPTITISGGVAAIKEPVPYIIKAPRSKLPFAVIDTSEGTIPAAELKAIIVLTKTKLMVNYDTSDMHSVDLSHVQNLIIDRNLINRWIEQFKNYFIFVVFPFALFFTFLYYLVQVLICASIGMLFAKKYNLKLSPRALVRLSVVAFTPPIVLQTVHALLDIEFPYASVISLLLAACYLYFAIGACSGKTISKIA